MSDFAKQFSKKLSKDLFVFFYQGSFLSKPSINILEVLEKNIEEVLTRKMSKRAFFFGIEIIQNIEKYSANNDEINDSITLIKNENGVQLISENAIKNSEIPKLKNHIDLVLNSSKEDLDEFHINRLKNSLNEDAKSPGLGLIEMKRRGKGSSELSYEFIEVDNDFSIYKLVLSVSENVDNEVDLELYNLVKNNFRNNMSAIFYTGLFDNNLLFPIISLIENIKLVEDKTIVSKYQHCIIEMIQNANEHGRNEYDIGGFFSLFQTDESISISCCNLINSDVDLIKKIEDLNTKSEAELKELNKSQLMDFTSEGGLGFIQLAQYSRPSPLKAKTFSVDKQYNFFYIENQFEVNEI